MQNAPWYWPVLFRGEERGGIGRKKIKYVFWLPNEHTTRDRRKWKLSMQNWFLCLLFYVMLADGGKKQHALVGAKKKSLFPATLFHVMDLVCEVPLFGWLGFGVKVRKRKWNTLIYIFYTTKIKFLDKTYQKKCHEKGMMIIF